MPVIPGSHLIVIGREDDAFEARSAGFHLRDTILILLPEGRTLFAYLFRWPLEGTVAENVLKYGVGGINIDGCRISTSENLNGGAYAPGGRAAPMPGDERQGASLGMYNPGQKTHTEYKQPGGRWPTNLLLIHGPECRRVGEKKIIGHAAFGSPANSKGGILNKTGEPRKNPHPGFTNEDGTETVAAWECQPGCPVRTLDEMSGRGNSPLTDRPKTSGTDFGLLNDDSWQPKGCTIQGYADSGGASRFFPQFQSLPEALDWLTKLIGAPKPEDPLVPPA